MVHLKYSRNMKYCNFWFRQKKSVIAREHARYLISLVQIKSRRTDNQFKDTCIDGESVYSPRDWPFESAETVPRLTLVGGRSDGKGKEWRRIVAEGHAECKREQQYPSSVSTGGYIWYTRRARSKAVKVSRSETASDWRHPAVRSALSSRPPRQREVRVAADLRYIITPSH